MAAFLDVSLLKGFSFVLVFLLVWALVYALLKFTNFLKADQPIQSIVALVIALLTSLSPQVGAIVTIIVPWFGLLFIFLVFMLVGIMLLGVKAEQISEYITKGPTSTPIMWVIVVSSIIFIAGIGLVYFSDSGSSSGVGTTSPSGAYINGTSSSGGTINVPTGDIAARGPNALLATIFHPRMLGILFVMMLATFTAALLVK